MKISLLVFSLFIGFFNPMTTDTPPLGDQVNDETTAPEEEQPETPLPVENPIVVDKVSYELSISDQVVIVHNTPAEYPVSFVSSNPNIASVSESGLITGVSAGKVVITLKTVVGDEAFEKTVEVLVLGLDGTLNFKLNEFYLIRDFFVDLEYTVSDSLKGQTIVWSSSDPTIASVENGRVYGVSLGSTTIHASIGDIVASIEVDIILPLKQIEFNPDSMTLTLDDRVLIPPLIYVPYDTSSHRGADYVSLNPEIVTVEDGEIVAVGVGDAIIKASVGSIETELEVHVNPKKAESGADILKLSVDRIHQNQMILKVDDISRYNARRFVLVLPTDEILEFVKSEPEAQVLIVLDDILLKNSMTNLESFNVSKDVLALLTDRVISFHLVNAKNQPLLVYHFDKPATDDVNLRFTLEEISETSSLYQKIGVKSSRLRFFNSSDYRFKVEVDAGLLGSSFSQYHFIYKNDNGVLEDTKQDVSVDQTNRIQFYVDSNDYVITFSRIALGSNQNIIFALLSFLLIGGGAYGVYYFKVLKKRQ